MERKRASVLSCLGQYFGANLTEPGGRVYMLLLWRRLQAGTGEPTGDILRRSLIEMAVSSGECISSFH